MSTSLTSLCFHAENMSVWEKRPTESPQKGLLLPVITSAAIKALHSIPQLGLDGFHLDLHPAILTGFNAVITSHPSLATRLTACAVMAHTYYTSMVFARDLTQRGLLQAAKPSVTLVHQKDMVLSMYRIMQEALQVCLFYASCLGPANIHGPFASCCAPHPLPDMQNRRSLHRCIVAVASLSPICHMCIARLRCHVRFACRCNNRGLRITVRL